MRHRQRQEDPGQNLNFSIPDGGIGNLPANFVPLAGGWKNVFWELYLFNNNNVHMTIFILNWA